MKFLLQKIYRLLTTRPQLQPKALPLLPQFSADQSIVFTCQPEELHPLTPSEQDELDTLLKASKASDVLANAISDITSLDGFLTCMVIGPQPTNQGEWLYYLFDGQLPKLTDIDTTRLLALIQRHHHSLTLDFAKTKPHYRPLFTNFTRAKNAKPVGKKLRDELYWCNGFMQATQLRWTQWHKLLDPHESYSLLYGPWLLGTAEGHDWQMKEVRNCYRDEGYDAEEVHHMALRWFTLPSTHVRTLADLKKSILHIHAYWKMSESVRQKMRKPLIGYAYKIGQVPFQTAQ